MHWWLSDIFHTLDIVQKGNNFQGSYFLPQRQMIIIIIHTIVDKSNIKNFVALNQL